MSSSALQLRFWGVRGSIPTPHADRLGYGGNTSCLEVRYRDLPPLIFDAGSGLRSLGSALASKFGDAPLAAHIFLTHFHWDHIQGIPFLSALHCAESRITFHSACPASETHRILGNQMEAPYFPISLPAALASVDYEQFGCEATRFEDLIVTAFPLRHPGGCSGFRIDTPEGAIVYATDHEHGDPELDEILLRQADGAKILIYDAQYTPGEYETRRGWGHSTWFAGAETARRAGVQRLVLFHHDPERTDGELDRLTSNARGEFAMTAAAREGESLCLL